MKYRLELEPNEFIALRLAVLDNMAKLETRISELRPRQNTPRMILNEELADLEAVRVKIDAETQRGHKVMGLI